LPLQLIHGLLLDDSRKEAFICEVKSNFCI